MSDFILNGVAIKSPSSFKISRYMITDVQRLTNGLMVGDIVARKLKFFFTYDALDAKDMNNILDALWNTDSLFVPFTYPYEGKSKTVTVYVGELPQELHRATGTWVWKNISFNLIEQ